MRGMDETSPGGVRALLSKLSVLCVVMGVKFCGKEGSRQRIAVFKCRRSVRPGT